MSVIMKRRDISNYTNRITECSHVNDFRSCICNFNFSFCQISGKIIDARKNETEEVSTNSTITTNTTESEVFTLDDTTLYPDTNISDSMASNESEEFFGESEEFLGQSGEFNYCILMNWLGTLIGILVGIALTLLILFVLWRTFPDVIRKHVNKCGPSCEDLENADPPPRPLETRFPKSSANPTPPRGEDSTSLLFPKETPYLDLSSGNKSGEKQSEKPESKPKTQQYEDECHKKLYENI